MKTQHCTNGVPGTVERSRCCTQHHAGFTVTHCAFVSVRSTTHFSGIFQGLEAGHFQLSPQPAGFRTMVGSSSY